MALSPGVSENPAKLGLMMVTAMLRRPESRGGHSRTDFPATDCAQATRKTLTWAQTLEQATNLPAIATPRRATGRTL